MFAAKKTSERRVEAEAAGQCVELTRLSIQYFGTRKWARTLPLLTAL